MAEVSQADSPAAPEADSMEGDSPVAAKAVEEANSEEVVAQH